MESFVSIPENAGEPTERGCIYIVPEGRTQKGVMSFTETLSWSDLG